MKRKKKKKKGKSDNPSPLRTLNMGMLWLSWLFLPENDQTAKTKNLILSLVLCRFLFLMVHYVECILHTRPSPSCWGFISQLSLSCLWLETLMTSFYFKSFLKGWINGNKMLGLPRGHQVNGSTSTEMTSRINKMNSEPLEPLGRRALCDFWAAIQMKKTLHHTIQKSRSKVQLLQLKVF